ncbi:MAG: T9SS type A sorting domain-containing protein [Chitinophagales bacterium]
MKKLNVSTFALFLILICNNFFAQNHLPRFENIEDNEAKIFNELNLSPEQITQLKTIREKYAPKLKEIRDETREMHQKNIAQIKEIRLSQKAELEKILTEEQINLFQEKRQRISRNFLLQSPHFEGHRIDAEKLHAIRKETHGYVLRYVLPVLKAQRAKLNPSISTDDKAKIEELRKTFQAIKSQIKTARKEIRNAFRNGESPTKKIAHLRAIREQNQPDMEQARVLVEKYGSEIESLKIEIEADILQWETDIKAIADKHFEGEDMPKYFHRHLLHRHPLLYQMLPKIRFLLLDPNMDYSLETLGEEDEVFEERQISIFPNPTTQMNTIEFEVKKAGNVRIDLMGRNGVFIRTIFDEYQTEGTHQVKVNIADLTDHLYFYVVSDESGQTTKEFLISR